MNKKRDVRLDGNLDVHFLSFIFVIALQGLAIPPSAEYNMGETWKQSYEIILSSLNHISRTWIGRCLKSQTDYEIYRAFLEIHVVDLVKMNNVTSYAVSKHMLKNIALNLVSLTLLR